MPLVSMKELLEDALRNKYAVGYFESWNLDSLEAVLEAAEEKSSPIIIGFGASSLDQDWFDHRGLKFFAALGKMAAKESKVPTGLILNEVKTLNQVKFGLEYGFNTVMMDSSHLPLEKNIEITKEVVGMAHTFGASVEAQLGMVPDASEKQREKPSFTKPEETKIFVEETKVDALSISVGNEHLRTEGKSEINFDLIERIHTTTDTFLVIHGGSGLPPEGIKKMIDFGITKFNIGTILKKVYYETIKRECEHLGENIDYQLYVGSRKLEDIFFLARERIKDEVKKFIDLFL